MTYIEYIRVDELQDIKKRIEILEGEKIILSEITNYPDAYYIVRVKNKKTLNIGLAVETPYRPDCVELEGLVFIGYNYRIDAICDKNVKCSFVKDSYFYKFVKLKDSLLAVFETEIIRIDMNCNVVWNYNAHGVIETYEINDDSLDIVVDSLHKKVKLY